MKKLSVLLLCAFLALPFPAHAESLPTVAQKAERTKFADSIGDLPVMKGLEVVEDKELLVIFGPRPLTQVTLTGKVDVDQVYYFYSDALSALGWQYVTMKLFERGDEKLTLTVSSANGRGITNATFAVSPIND